MVKRRGSSSVGCLFSLLVLSAAVYFSITVATPFWTNFQFKDAMEQEVKFASTRTDAAIKRRLREKAIELDLPESAYNVRIRRVNGNIVVFTEYFLSIEFPGFVREVYFSPQAQGVY